MHAVIQTGGKQYRVKEGDLFFVEKLPGEAKSQVVFEKVLLLSDGTSVQIGTPHLEQARVACEIVEQFRGKKIIIFKYKRRKNHHKKKGHRQSYTRIRVTEIAADGKLTGKKAAATDSKAPIDFESAALQNG